MFDRINFSVIKKTELYAMLTENMQNEVYKNNLFLAVKNGDPKAQCLLAICYKHGYGVEVNGPKSIELLQLAAEQKFAPSQARLGDYYLYLGDHSRGAARQTHYTEALRLFTLAAQQKNIAAYHSLGLMHQTGRGTPVDRELGVRYTLLGAEHGIAESQNNLAVMYRKGEGLISNKKEAARLYRLAAENKHAPARKALIEMFNGLQKKGFFSKDLPINEDTAAIIYHTALSGGKEALSKFNFLAQNHTEKFMDLLEKYPEDYDKAILSLTKPAKSLIDNSVIMKIDLFAVFINKTTMDVETIRLILNYCTSGEFTRVIKDNDNLKISRNKHI